VITGVSNVVLYVDDQERAKDFWTEKMGFDLVQDSPYGDERWIEVTPPDKGLRLVLSVRPAGQAKNDVPAELPSSNVMFECDDLEQTYRELNARGVEFPQPPIREPWGWWSMFGDTDGIRYALGSRDEG